MGENLNELQIAEFKEAFTLLDKDNDGLVSIDQLGLLIRGLRQYPTNQEIEEWTQEIDPEGSKYFDFADFVSLMARKMKETNPEEELLEAFQSLDKNKTGIISTTELKFLITTNGENLTEAEADVLIKEADPENTTKIRYQDFVKLLTSSYMI